MTDGGWVDAVFGETSRSGRRTVPAEGLADRLRDVEVVLETGSDRARSSGRLPTADRTDR